MKRIQLQSAAALLLAAATLSLSGVAAAEAPPDALRYDFINVGLSLGEVDGPGDPDFTSFGVGGSWGFHDNFALFAGLGFGEVDSVVDVDSTEFAIGINPHFPIARNVDLVIPVALQWADFDGGGLSEDDTGYSIGVGVRWLVQPAFELGFGLNHVDIFDGDEQFFSASARWHINRLISLGGGATFSDDSSAVLLDARFSF